MASAILDANVLIPAALRDTLLRLAEYGLYEPLWSAHILEEVRSNVIHSLAIHAPTFATRVAIIMTA